jgi:hypothetical protein
MHEGMDEGMDVQGKQCDVCRAVSLRADELIDWYTAVWIEGVAQLGLMRVMDERFRLREVERYDACSLDCASRAAGLMLGSTAFPTRVSTIARQKTVPRLALAS